MMLMHVTVCDSAGRDASVLLDAGRITAIVPYTDDSPRPLFQGPGNNSRRPRNRSYLEVHMDCMCKWVVPASGWPRIKAALARFWTAEASTGPATTRKVSNARISCRRPRPALRPREEEKTDATQYRLRTSAAGAAAREEAADAVPCADANPVTAERAFPPAADRAVMASMDLVAEALACSPSR